MVRRIVVVGASLGGLRACEALRAQGFDGQLTLVGDELHPPYDRPPLSKQVLQGLWAPEQTAFRKKEGYDALALDMRLGVRATSLDVAARRVGLDDGAILEYDRVIIATGARARMLPGARARDGLHVLRTLSDAIALRDDLNRAQRVAIVGAGFIGLEVAASCRVRGLDVSLIEAFPLPLSPICGNTVGRLIADLHRDHGVDLRVGVTVSNIEGDSRVTGVLLSDGSRIAADVVVIGIGVIPNTGWLEGSGLALDNGIVCNEAGEAGPGVYAAGDVARMYNGWHGDRLRVEHWTNAVEQAAHVATNALGGHGASPGFSSVPYFWSDQYDRKIQFVGHLRADDELVVVDGSIGGRTLTALYRRGDRMTACLAINQPRALVKFRKLLAAHVSWEAALSALAADRPRPVRDDPPAGGGECAE
jgi:NADPH-dependent 2,4-dienoyl-CoA reductase/sulfur reductase-like enzyme